VPRTQQLLPRTLEIADDRNARFWRITLGLFSVQRFEELFSLDACLAQNPSQRPDL
jgi:hypothetical protein